MAIILTDTVLRDEGTIIVFGGTDEDGNRRAFAADRRVALPLAALILDEGAIECEVESWQLLGGGR